MTRQKLHVEGETYLKVLSEFLQAAPAFLGGNCTCSNCRRLLAGNSLGGIGDSSKSQHHGHVSDNDEAVNSYPVTDLPMNNNCDHVPWAVTVVFLMMWVVIAFFAGVNDPESFITAIIKCYICSIFFFFLNILSLANNTPTKCLHLTVYSVEELHTINEPGVVLFFM